MKNIDRIEILISKGEVEKAITELLKITSIYETNIKSDIILLSSQYHRWKKQSLLGQIENDTQLRRIESAVLNFAKKIQNQYPNLNRRERTQYTVVIEANFDIKDKEKIDKIMNALIFYSQDYSLKVKKIEKGSIIIRISGTKEGYEKLKKMFENNKLEDIIQFEIIDFYKIGKKAKKEAEEYIINELPSLSNKLLALNLSHFVPSLGFMVRDTLSSLLISKLLKNIAKIYGLETSGKVWDIISELLHSHYLVTSHTLSSKITAISFFNIKTEMILTHIYTLGKTIISFFEEHFPDQIAYEKPSVKELNAAFGEHISIKDLEEYINSY